MRSLQVEQYADEQSEHLYTELQVLQSAAGYYVGTLYKEDFGLVPGSRDSDYFATAEEAEKYLQSLLNNDPEERYRRHP